MPNLTDEMRKSIDEETPRMRVKTRDAFAAAAMTGMLASDPAAVNRDVIEEWGVIAEYAYQYADAMMAQRQKGLAEVLDEQRDARLRRDSSGK